MSPENSKKNLFRNRILFRINVCSFSRTIYRSKRVNKATILHAVDHCDRQFVRGVKSRMDTVPIQFSEECSLVVHRRSSGLFWSFRVGLRSRSFVKQVEGRCERKLGQRNARPKNMELEFCSGNSTPPFFLFFRTAVVEMDRPPNYCQNGKHNVLRITQDRTRSLDFEFGVGQILFPRRLSRFFPAKSRSR